MARFLMPMAVAWLLIGATTTSLHAASVQEDATRLADPMQAPVSVSTQQPSNGGAAVGAEDGNVAVNPLQALRLSSHRPMALIQGKWYRVGDLALGGKIVSIDDRGMRLRKDGSITSYPLFSASLAKPVNPSASKP